jgi:hypothetical protein
MKRNQAWAIALSVGLSTTSIAAAWSTRASADGQVAMPEAAVTQVGDVSVESNATVGVQTNVQPETRPSTRPTIVRYEDVYVYDTPAATVASNTSQRLNPTSRASARKKARATRVRSKVVRARSKPPATSAHHESDNNSESDNRDD